MRVVGRRLTVSCPPGWVGYRLVGLAGPVGGSPDGGLDGGWYAVAGEGDAA